MSTLRIQPFSSLANPEDTINTEVSEVSVLDVKELEAYRAKLLTTQYAGYRCGEIVQALNHVEQAILNIDHYTHRRAVKGIYTLLVPEDLTETHRIINQTKLTTIEFSFVIDSPNGSEIIHHFIIDKSYPAQEFYLIKTYLEYLSEREAVYFATETENKVSITFVMRENEREIEYGLLEHARSEMIELGEKNKGKAYYVKVYGKKGLSFKVNLPNKFTKELSNRIGITRFTLCNEHVVNYLNEQNISYGWRYDCPGVFIVFDGIHEGNKDTIEKTITEIVEEYKNKTNLIAQ